MESDILNVRDCGVTPGFGYGETNRIALQRAIDEMRGAGGGTIYIPTGVYEVAGAINVEISTGASATGTVRISGDGNTQGTTPLIDGYANTSATQITIYTGTFTANATFSYICMH
jgi:Pectate lyase superfamily protein